MAWKNTIIALALAGCGGTAISEPVQFVTDNGVVFHFESSDRNDKYTAYEMSYIEARLSDVLPWKKHLVLSKMHDVSVVLIDDEVDCAGSKCGGKEMHGVLTIMNTPANCPGQGAYAHEMTHWLLESITGNADAEHLNKKAWDATWSIRTNGSDCL